MSKIKELYGNSDKNQLLYAREQLDELIKLKEDQEKKLIWRVADKWMCLGNFAEDDYLLAVECLVKNAKELAEEKKTNPNLTRQEMHIEIYSQLVPLSEYKDYIDG